MAINEQIEELAKVLDSYERSYLECDDSIRVFHRVLSDRGAAHTIFTGIVILDEDHVTSNTWIDLDNGLRIDYCLQRALGVLPSIPHGVFDSKKFTTVRYDGYPLKMPILPWGVIQQLLKPPSWRLGRQSSKLINPPQLPVGLRAMLGKPLNEAKGIAERFGYWLEVLVPEIEISGGEERETGLVIIRSPYHPHKLNVDLNDNGNVVSYDY